MLNEVGFIILLQIDLACYLVPKCSLSFFKNIFVYLFIWVHWVLVTACGI